MAKILDLPDELLLEIGDHFYGRARNHDLTILSLVCQRFRAVAQEKLLCQPSFHIRHIDSYLWRLGHCSNLISKIKRLEILSSSKGRVEAVFPPGHWHIGEYPAVRYLPKKAKDEEKTEFITRCKEIITYYTRGRTDCVLLWTAALQDDVAQALLGVLLCALPNLRELCIGASWLMDFPMFSSTLVHQRMRCKPFDWREHDWMGVILDAFKTKLHSLEFPASFTDLDFHRSIAIFDFRDFSQLRYISVPMEALQWYKGRRNVVASPADPSLIFPSTLEILRISVCNEYTSNFMNELCLAKKRGLFPRLLCAELYFMTCLKYINELCEKIFSPNFLYDVRKMCADTELALSLYFPPDGHLRLERHLQTRTPWSLIGEGYSLCPHPFCNCAKETEVFRWDALGDVIMEEGSHDRAYLLGSPLYDV